MEGFFMKIKNLVSAVIMSGMLLAVMPVYSQHTQKKESKTLLKKLRHELDKLRHCMTSAECKVQRKRVYQTMAAILALIGLGATAGLVWYLKARAAEGNGDNKPLIVRQNWSGNANSQTSGLGGESKNQQTQQQSGASSGSDEYDLSNPALPRAKDNLYSGLDPDAWPNLQQHK